MVLNALFVIKRLLVSTLLLTVSCAGFSQSSSYVYDQAGRLVSDLSEEIGTISWNNRDKVMFIERIDGSQRPDISYTYDASGNRTSSLVKPKNDSHRSPEENWLYVYYIYDHAGDIIATYVREYQNISSDSLAEGIRLKEVHLYSSDIIGSFSSGEIFGAFSKRHFLPIVGDSGQFIQKDFGDIIWDEKSELGHDRGLNQFELVNHLGNINVVSSDRKIGQTEAEPIVAQDYYPFGMLLPGRPAPTASYSFGYNRMEKEDEVKGANNSYYFISREYDPRLARFVTIDPEFKKYSGQSPYVFAANSPIQYIDRKGKSPGTAFATEQAAIEDFSKLYGSLSIIQNREFGATIYKVQEGKKSYFTYSLPNRGAMFHVRPSKPGRNRDKVIDLIGQIHTHGAYDAHPNNNKFSKEDIENADKDYAHYSRSYNIKWKSWLVTTSGVVLLYESQKKKNDKQGITEYHKNAPSDKKDPNRKNKVEPVEPKNEEAPYISTEE